MATTVTRQPNAPSDAAGGKRIAVPRLRVDLGTGLHAASLLAAAVIILYLGRNHWYDVDEWTFVVYRTEDPSIGLFTPLNEHWMTIPVLIYRTLFVTVGLDSYVPFLGVVVVLHLLLTHLLWRASVRAGADPLVAAAVSGVFAVLGSGGENLTLAIQMGFVGAVAFGWLAVLCHDHPGPFDRRDVAGWAASVVALMFSGPALAMVGVAAVCAALRRRSLRDVGLIVAVPALVYGTWWALVGRHYSATTMADLTLLVDFVWHGVINVVDQTIGISGSGVVLVLAMLWWWMRHPSDATGPGAVAAVAAAGFVGAFAWFAVTGGGRAAYGIQYAELSRYVYIGAAMLVPTAALILTQALPTAALTRGAIVLLCAATALHNVQLLRDRSAEEVGREQALKRQIVAAADLLSEDVRLVEHPAGLATGKGLLAPLLFPDRLQLLMDAGWDLDGPTGSRERLAAELLWQVGIESPAGDLGAGSGTAAATGSGFAVERTWAAEGCASVRAVEANAHLLLEGDASGLRVRLRSAEPVRLPVQLVAGLDASDRRSLLLAPRPQDLVSHAPHRTLALTLPPDHPLLLCGTTLSAQPSD